DIVPVLLVPHQRFRRRLEVFERIRAETAVRPPGLAIHIVRRGARVIAGGTKEGNPVLRDIRGSPGVHAIDRVGLVVLVVNGPVLVLKGGGTGDIGFSMTKSVFDSPSVTVLTFAVPPPTFRQATHQSAHSYFRLGFPKTRTLAA